MVTGSRQTLGSLASIAMTTIQICATQQVMSSKTHTSPQEMLANLGKISQQWRALRAPSGAFGAELEI